MWKRNVLFTFWAISLLACQTTHPMKQKCGNGYDPVAVLVERHTNSTSNDLGLFIPRLVLYADGTLIYLKKGEKNQSCYVRKKLSKISVKNLTDSLISDGGLGELKKFYKISSNTDLFIVDIYLCNEGRPEAISVYGMYPSAEDDMKVLTAHREQEPDRLPEEFFELYNKMTGVSYNDAEKWIPEYIEVLIWEYGRSSKEPLKWPDEWPDLNHSLTRKQGEGIYSILIPGEKADQVKKFFSDRKMYRAIQINGKKWSGFYRFVFPGESVWIKAFRENNKKDVDMVWDKFL